MEWTFVLCFIQHVAHKKLYPWPVPLRRGEKKADERNTKLWQNIFISVGNRRGKFQISKSSLPNSYSFKLHQDVRSAWELTAWYNFRNVPSLKKNLVQMIIRDSLQPKWFYDLIIFISPLGSPVVNYHICGTDDLETEPRNKTKNQSN